MPDHEILQLKPSATTSPPSKPKPPNYSRWPRSSKHPTHVPAQSADSGRLATAKNHTADHRHRAHDVDEGADTTATP